MSRRRAVATNTDKKLQITTTSAAHRHFNEALLKNNTRPLCHLHVVARTHATPLTTEAGEGAGDEEVRKLKCQLFVIYTTDN